jgi:DNA-binding NtrC family response regulator
VAVNCGAIPASLIAAELFGYERGAFTGAERRRQGRLEQADGGTVLLDEIADLPLDLQSHLLRFLQEGTVDRLGGAESVPVNARVIAATHMDLAEAVRAGRLREDLYYRLNVLNLHMPALRERREDIPLLANHFLEHFRKEYGGRCCGFTPQALEIMEFHDWPGNVRELINRVRRAVVMGESRLIGVDHLGLERRQNSRTESLKTLQEARRGGERAAILAALRNTRKNISVAARQLDISRVTLYRLMQRHGIKPNGCTEPGDGPSEESPARDSHTTPLIYRT